MVVVRALGVAEITVGDLRIKPTSTKKFAFLLYLAAERGRRVPRSALRELLFPELPEKNAAHALRELVYQLRQAGAGIETDKDSVWLPAEAVRSDFSEVIAAEQLNDEQVRAVEGGFLPGFAPSWSESYSEWYDRYCSEQQLAICRAILQHLHDSRDTGDWRLVERLSRACLAVDPLNERATLALAEVLAQGGSTAAAVELLDQHLSDFPEALPSFTAAVREFRSRISEQAAEGYHADPTFKFFGRSTEMHLLVERAKNIRRGRSRSVVLCGEPGIGKTRISKELMHRLRLEGWSCLHIAATPRDSLRPMSIFAELSPQLVGAPGALGAAPSSLAWLRRLTARHDPDTHDLRNVSDGDIAAAVANAIVDVFEAVSSESPILLVCDDLQWVDDASFRMLQTLGSGTQLHLLIVLTSRNAARALEIGQSSATFDMIDVGPLTSDACTSIIGSAPFPVDAQLTNWMVDACHGNPFYLECLAAHYSVTGERFVVPNSLSAILDQRLETLPAESLDVLSATVALGKWASLDRIASVMELPTSNLYRAISNLEKARLILTSDRMQPAHWLIAEAEQKRATPLAQRLLHTRVARQLESEIRNGSDQSMIWDCAGAWIRAGDPTQAATLLARCADHAKSIGRARDAAELFLRSAELSEGDLRTTRCTAAYDSALRARDFDLVRGASVTARRDSQTHDALELAEVHAQMLLEEEGEADLTRIEACVRAPTASAEHRLGAAFAHFIFCDYARNVDAAVALFPALAALSLKDGDAEPETRLKCLIAYHSSFGNVELLLELCSQLVELADGVTPDVAAYRYRIAANGFWRAGYPDKALFAWSRAYDLANAIGLDRVCRMLALVVSGCWLDVEDLEQYQRWTDRFRDAYGEPRDAAEHLYAHSVQLRMAFATGNDEMVSRHCATLLESKRLPGGLRARRWIMAAGTLRSAAEGNIDLGASRQALTSYHHAGYETGDISDFEIAVLIAIHDMAGDAQGARQVFGDYVRRYRRGNAILSGPIRSAIGRIGATELPQWHSLAFERSTLVCRI